MRGTFFSLSRSPTKVVSGDAIRNGSSPTSVVSSSNLFQGCWKDLFDAGSLCPDMVCLLSNLRMVHA